MQGLALTNDQPMLVLGIETTCDETAAAVVERQGDGSGRILSNVVRSQIDEHARFGGVVPEIAARAHVDLLDGIVDRAMKDAGVSYAQLSAVAAAAGPGLIGGVIVGLTTAKAIALVPAMAAREVVVSALGTVYALSATGDEAAAQLGTLIAQQWSLATALSLLVWFIFAPQCISTIAAVRRETNGWRWPLVMTGYLFALAYGASFITYRIALAFHGG